MKASDWIDQVKAKHGWTDYRAAQELGITKGGMSQIRTGDSKTLGEETAIKVAEFLGEKPEIILVDQAMERSRTADGRSALRRVLTRIQRKDLAAAIGLVAIIVGGGFPQDADAARTPLNITSVMSTRDSVNLYIVSTWIRAFVRRLTSALAPAPCSAFA